MRTLIVPQCGVGTRPLRHRHPPRHPTGPKEQPRCQCRLPNLLFILSLLHGLVVNRPSEPTIYPKFAAWFGSYNPNTISRKIETPIFQVEKPSTETTATTFSISGIEAQHEQVAMAMHNVTMETRYIPEKQNSNYMYMYINGTTLIIVTDIPAVEGNSQKGV